MAQTARVSGGRVGRQRRTQDRRMGRMGRVRRRMQLLLAEVSQAIAVPVSGRTATAIAISIAADAAAAAAAPAGPAVVVILPPCQQYPALEFSSGNTGAA